MHHFPRKYQYVILFLLSLCVNILANFVVSFPKYVNDIKLRVLLYFIFEFVEESLYFVSFQVYTNLPITANSYNDELKYIRTLAQDNGFHTRTTNKLLYKHKKKQNLIIALETRKENTNNN